VDLSVNERAIENLFNMSRLVLQPTVGNENQQGMGCDVILTPYDDKAKAELLINHSEPHEEQPWKR
jgi:hypothetical protein